MDLKSTQLKDTYGNLLTIGTTAGSPQTGTLENGDGEDITELRIGASGDSATESTLKIFSQGRVNATVLKENSDGASLIVGSANRLSLGTSNDEKIRIEADGDIAFYDDANNQGLFWDASTARLGLGTQTPGHPLTVTANPGLADTPVAWIHNSGNATSYDGTVISTVNDGSDVEVLHVRTNNTTYANGTSLMLVRGDGNVGIGEANPSNKLEVNSGSTQTVSLFKASSTSTTTNNGGALIGIRNTNDTNGNMEGLFFQNSNGVGTSGIIGYNVNHSTNEGLMTFGVRNSSGTFGEKMRIDSSGNVGIGVAPAQTLNVVNNNAYQLRLGTPNSAGVYWEMGRDNVSTGDFLISNGTERMRITSDGYVGIGTGDTDVQSGDLIGVLAFNSKDISTNSSGAIGSIRSYATAPFNTGAVSGDLRFYTQNNAAPNGSLLSGTERMRIDASGNILFGGITGLPNGTSIYGSAFRVDSNGRMGLRLATSSSSAQDLAEFYNPNGLVGTIRTNGSATSYETSSDYRLKENVVEMTGALDRVDQLKPSRFNFIADADTTVDGFLAHEVADVVPEAISGEKDATEEYEVTPAVLDDEGNVIEEAVMGTRPVYQGIDQSKLVPLLVGAIQELRAEIEQLKNQ